MTPCLRSLCLAPRDSLRRAMALINASGKGIALVVDDEYRLRTVITDGDLRREVLAGRSLDRPVAELHPKHQAVTVRIGTPYYDILALMKRRSIRHIPLIDADGRLCDLALLDDLLFEENRSKLNVSAVVMAGGRGQRLHPLTDAIPKPLLTVGKKPVVQRTIEQLRSAGVVTVFMATHYKPECFTQHFGNGERFGVSINYLHEKSPLGTAGALTMLPESAQPVLVVNGDILTRVSYRAMLAFHEENRADMTVAVRKVEISVPYGVIHNDGATINNIIEKPIHSFFVNAGIYLIEPKVRSYVPYGRRFDMTDLISSLVANRKHVVAFPISEYWLDIGQMTDYEKAQADFAEEAV